MTTPAWRIFVRGRYLGSPSVFVGTTVAESKAEALADAQLRYYGKAVEIVSEIAWQAMTERERTIFNGTFEPPTDDPHPNIRRTKCIRCNAEILYGRDHTGKWRKPPLRCHGPGCIPREKSGDPLLTDDAEPVG